MERVGPPGFLLSPCYFPFTLAFESKQLIAASKVENCRCEEGVRTDSQDTHKVGIIEPLIPSASAIPANEKAV